MFSGFTEDTYRFLWELAFHNERAFFEANRERYRQVLYQPLLALTTALIPTVREIDDRLNLRPASTISRIRRDTRYSKDQSMYRDHAWLGYKMPDSLVSECFSIYAAIEREEYSYGMGMYAPNNAVMQPMRERMLARPQKFLSLVTDPAFTAVFSLEGQPYRRAKYPNVSEALFPYVSRRSLSFCFSSRELSRTMRPELFDEIQGAFLLLKPVYRFLMGLD